jgi:hypothetical protein
MKTAQTINAYNQQNPQLVTQKNVPKGIIASFGFGVFLISSSIARGSISKALAKKRKRYGKQDI